jgi:hypothetical protein
MDAIHRASRDIQGVLGQVFLSRFDYLLDVGARRLQFGTQQLEGRGTRARFDLVHERPAVSTSLGWLVLDSGADVMVRFGVESRETTREMITVTGTARAGTVFSTLIIGGRTLCNSEGLHHLRVAEGARVQSRAAASSSDDRLPYH